MKVLFVIENYIPHIGGVEIVFRELGENLAKLGHRVDILTRRLPGTKRFEIINRVRVHRINCINRYLFSFLAIPKAIKLAKDADIIHTTTYNGALPARIASMLTKKPAVITVHEVLGKNWQKLTGMNFISAAMHRFLESRIMKLKFDRFVSVSKSTERGVLNFAPKEKSVVVYDGVDYDFWNPGLYDGERIRKKLKLNGFVYMFYGRPGISKGLEYLIRAVPIISKEIGNSKLLAIVSKDKAYLKRRKFMLKLIKKLKIENDVIFLEPVLRAELPNYIKASDCVVVPSLTEGFGFAAAEACAMGKPVVASNTTSLPEVVSGRYYLAYPASPEDIARGVIAIKKGKAEKKPIKRFKLADNVKGYLKVYAGLLKRKNETGKKNK